MKAATMRDLAFIAFLLALFAAGFRRPFLFVLAYVYIDIVSPQRLTYYLLNAVPISLIAVLLAVGGWALADDKRDTRVAPRQLLLLALLVYCGITTMSADFPLEAGDKWDWVWKALAFGIFLPLTLRTRLRLEALLTFMVVATGSIIVVGGIKTLASGGGYGELNLMVSDNTGLYEGSIISTFAVAVVPLALWLTREGTIFPRDWKVKAYGWALCFACLLIPVGTSARTGLLCVALLAVMMLRTVKRRLLYLGALGAVAACAVPLLPSAYTDRMNTIKTYQGDESASTRLAVWQWTIDYAREHPFGGGFDAFRGNHVRYELTKTQTQGDTTAVANSAVTDKARAYHSAYFEMLGEQGYPGLALWLAIHLLGVVRMEVLRRRYRHGAEDMRWAGGLADALQQAHLVYLLGGAFVGIAYTPFIYMIVGAEIGLDTYCARRALKGREHGFRPARARPAVVLG